MIEPLIQASEAGNLYLLNGLHTEIYSSKLLMDYLFREEYHHLYSEEEIKSIERSLPNSRILTFNIYDEVIKKRENIVLKPSNGYGGKGILLGWNFREEEWIKIVEKCIKSKYKYVVQDRVIGSTEDNFSIEDGNIVRKKMNSTWGFYLFNGEFSGVMYRGMDTHKGEIVNAAQGAGMTATFIKYS